MQTLASIQARDSSIDQMKALATLLITYSHLHPAFQGHTDLAGGGTFGNALFLYISGYLLIKSKFCGFAEWCVKRIGRCYLTMWVMLLLSALVTGVSITINFKTISGWESASFISMLFGFWIVFWFIRRFFTNRLGLVLIIIMATTIFLAGLSGFSTALQPGTLIVTIMYYASIFIFVAYGFNREFTKKTHSSLFDSTGILICIIFYYGILFISKKYNLSTSFQAITLIFITFLPFFIHKFFSSIHISYGVWTKNIIKFLSSITLEMYLVQPLVVWNSTFFTSLFPFNIIILLSLACLYAYILKVLTKSILCLLDGKYRQWQELLKLES